MSRKQTASGAPRDGQKIHYLTKSQLFAGVPEEKVRQVEGMLHMNACHRGAQLFGEGQSGEMLYVLKKGRVRLYKLSPSGKELTIDILGPGAVFGEMAVMGQGMYNLHAEALEESLVCRMSRADVQKVIALFPQVALNVMEILGLRVRWLEDQLEDIGLHQARARIASLLLRLPGSADSSGRKVLSMRYTQEELAKMAGLSRETASLTINQFRTEHLLDLTLGRRIRLLDAAELESQIQG